MEQQSEAARQPAVRAGRQGGRGGGGRRRITGPARNCAVQWRDGLRQGCRVLGHVQPFMAPLPSLSARTPLPRPAGGPVDSAPTSGKSGCSDANEWLTQNCRSNVRGNFDCDAAFIPVKNTSCMTTQTMVRSTSACGPALHRSCCHKPRSEPMHLPRRGGSRARPWGGRRPLFSTLVTDAKVWCGAR